MKHKLIYGALICATIAGLTAQKARAQAASDSLILVFRDPNVSTNLEVDLGNYLSPISSVSLNTVLTSLYGSWATNSNLTWAVVGADSTGANNDLFISAPDPNPSSPDGGNYSFNSSAASSIDEIYAGYGSSPSAGTELQDATTNSTSYTYQYNAELSGFFDATFESTADIGSGSDSADVFELATSPSNTQTDLGTVTLNSSGQFTTYAVPEPSTWASIVLGAGCLLAFRRRRRA